jgi:hypothetical protein
MFQIAHIAGDDGLILLHSANPTGSNFRERQGVQLRDFIDERGDQLLLGPLADIRRANGVNRPVIRLCVPKTSSVLIARPNRLNVSGDDRAALLLPDPVRLAVQVKEPT